MDGQARKDYQVFNMREIAKGTFVRPLRETPRGPKTLREVESVEEEPRRPVKKEKIIQKNKQHGNADALCLSQVWKGFQFKASTSSTRKNMSTM